MRRASAKVTTIVVAVLILLNGAPAPPPKALNERSAAAGLGPPSSHLHPDSRTASRTIQLPLRSSIETRQLMHPSLDGTTTGPASNL